MDGDGGLPTESPLENLYQALVESFGVIVCGYVAGRLGIVSEQQSGGLSTFVGTFSLPALIFVSIATLDLTSVSWYFLLSILLAKGLVFFAVLFITLLVTKPPDPARAAIFAIFCTQSNDFAIGFPIVRSIYEKSHPDFLSYVWLLAPVNLVILNPIGFTLMELGKRKGENRSRWSLARHVLCSIMTNPIVFMTALAIAANLIFRHALPSALFSLLNVLGSAFSGTALFLLGLRMVGSVRNFRGAALLVPALLIATKGLILPVVMREMSSTLLHSLTSFNSTAVSDLSTFGFLYGTFPSAPGVFVYATTYSLQVELIAGGMVASTFLSAPLMFISAKLISVSNMLPKDFIPALRSFEIDVSIASTVASVILIVVFIMKKNHLKMPQRITLVIIISQFVSCVGVLLGRLNFANVSYIEFALVRFGDFSGRLWTACLAITLALIEAKNFSSLVRLQPFFVASSWGLPLVGLCLMLLISDSDQLPPRVPEEFFFGPLEAPITVIIHLVALIVSVVYLILQQRYKRRYARYLVYSREASDAPHASIDPPTDRDEETPLDESLVENPDETQPIHHITLLFFLVSSIFVSLSVSVWRLVMDDKTPVYLELSFLDTALTRGQNLFLLLIFGFDLISFLHPVFKRFVHMFSRDEGEVVGGEGRPPVGELPEETQHLCDQFTTYHLEPCRNDIARRKRLWERPWESVVCFTGSELVSWLLREGLVKDREEGEVYGGHLTAGGLLRPLAAAGYTTLRSSPSASHHFSDDTSLYSFHSGG